MNIGDLDSIENIFNELLNIDKSDKPLPIKKEKCIANLSEYYFKHLKDPIATYLNDLYRGKKLNISTIEAWSSVLKELQEYAQIRLENDMLEKEQLSAINTLIDIINNLIKKIDEDNVLLKPLSPEADNILNIVLNSDVMKSHNDKINEIKEKIEGTDRQVEKYDIRLQETSTSIIV